MWIFRTFALLLQPNQGSLMERLWLHFEGNDKTSMFPQHPCKFFEDIFWCNDVFCSFAKIVTVVTMATWRILNAIFTIFEVEWLEYINFWEYGMTGELIS